MEKSDEILEMSNWRNVITYLFLFQTRDLDVHDLLIVVGRQGKHKWVQPSRRLVINDEHSVRCTVTVSQLCFSKVLVGPGKGKVCDNFIDFD
jgi:hypothetical protein